MDSRDRPSVDSAEGSALEGGEAFTLDDVSVVETSRGSTYRYLPDGTTRRFKLAEGREYEPQQALVYVPDYAWVRSHGRPEVLQKLGESEVQYEQILLIYIHERGRAAYIVDQKGNKVETNEKIAAGEGPVYLALTTSEKPDFFIPVSHKPQIGFSTFDTRTYFDEQRQKMMRETHLGNKVVKITLKDGRVITDTAWSEDVHIAK